MNSTNISMNETDGTGALGHTVGQASSSAHRLIESATEATRPTVDRLSQGAHQAVDTLAGAAASAALSLDTGGRRLRDAQARMVDACCSRFRAQPIMSVGVAIAAGVLLNWFLRRR